LIGVVAVLGLFAVPWSMRTDLAALPRLGQAALLAAIGAVWVAGLFGANVNPFCRLFQRAGACRDRRDVLSIVVGFPIAQLDTRNPGRDGKVLSDIKRQPGGGASSMAKRPRVKRSLSPRSRGPDSGSILLDSPLWFPRTHRRTLGS
jgi:hypothetical protein